MGRECEQMKVRVIEISNGDRLIPYRIYTCVKCGKVVEEAWPREIIDDKVYCGDCAFKLGKISESEYIKKHCFFIDITDLRAVIHKGKIYLGTGKFPWERTSRDRECKEYKEWRMSVFARDGFECQICGKVGGKLNAHHIKPYKDCPESRYEVRNGVTLCEACHKKIHKDKDHEWIHTGKPENR